MSVLVEVVAAAVVVVVAVVCVGRLKAVVVEVAALGDVRVQIHPAWWWHQLKVNQVVCQSSCKSAAAAGVLTWSHLGSFDLTWSLLDSRGLTWFHLVSLGLTWTDLSRKRKEKPLWGKRGRGKPTRLICSSRFLIQKLRGAHTH